MKSIYILLTKSDTYVSKAIKFVTKDTYTHASISFEKNLQPLYSFSRKYVNLPLPAGLRIEPLTAGFYKKYKEIPCALYELKVEENVYQNAKEEVETMMKTSNTYHFNLLGLFLCKLNIPFHREKCYFCSEFVSEILSRNKALLLPKEPSCMRPNDYTKFSELSCQFEGRLQFLIQKIQSSLYIKESL
ncbi:hypothetical protein [Floccifex sp.]|uniref:hypothetical protein n=1 Tax=Floccifex sp. TaxID=2815810 RepID=UPI003EFFE27A